MVLSVFCQKKIVKMVGVFGSRTHWLMVALAIVSVIGQSPGVLELMARNELLYETIRKDFSFEILEESIDEVNMLPMELRNEDGDLYTCSLGHGDMEEIIQSENEDVSKVQDTSIVQDKSVDLVHKESLDSKLSALEGKCETLNMGWWSYQWCYKKEVKQFHVDVSKGTIDPEWSLGKYEYSLKNIKVDDIDDDDLMNDNDDDIISDDYFENGQRCDETNTNRKTRVHFQCCNDDEEEETKNKKNSGNKRKKGKNGNIGKSLATFKSITENEVCSYEAIICTSLLCDETMTSDIDSKNNSPMNKLTKDDSAITLLKTLKKEKGGGTCLIRHEGWWSYEFCYMGQVRQFHLVQTAPQPSSDNADKKTKEATVRIEAEFLLGKASKHLEEITLQDEKEKYIIPPPVDDPNAPSSIQMEYQEGTPCDLVNTPRSTTIQYICGNMDSIVSIVEDRTCHYHLVISSLHLCKHPSFVQRQPPTLPIKCDKVNQEDKDIDEKKEQINPFKLNN